MMLTRVVLLAAVLIPVAPGGVSPTRAPDPRPAPAPVEVVSAAGPVEVAPAPRAVSRSAGVSLDALRAETRALIEERSHSELSGGRNGSGSVNVRSSVSCLAFRGGCGTGYMQMYDRVMPPLLALGVAAYPEYEAILADPASESGEVRGVCVVLSRLEGDRSHFARLVVRRLTDPNMVPPDERECDAFLRGFRFNRDSKQSLIWLLAEIGTEKDAAVLVRFLDGEDADLRWTAIQTMAQIGGQSELEAINTWLTGQNHNAPVVREIIEQRNAFELRLEARKAPAGP